MKSYVAVLFLLCSSLFLIKQADACTVTRRNAATGVETVTTHGLNDEIKCTTEDRCVKTVGCFGKIDCNERFSCRGSDVSINVEFFEQDKAGFFDEADVECGSNACRGATIKAKNVTCGNLACLGTTIIEAELVTCNARKACRQATITADGVTCSGHASSCEFASIVTPCLNCVLGCSSCQLNGQSCPSDGSQFCPDSNSGKGAGKMEGRRHKRRRAATQNMQPHVMTPGGNHAMTPGGKMYGGKMYHAMYPGKPRNK